MAHKTLEELEAKFQWRDGGVTGKIEDAEDAVYMMTQWIDLRLNQEEPDVENINITISQSRPKSCAWQLAALEYIAELQDLRATFTTHHPQWLVARHMDSARAEVKKVFLHHGTIDAAHPIILTGRVAVLPSNITVSYVLINGLWIIGAIAAFFLVLMSTQ